jgi:hypothetical protein
MCVHGTLSFSEHCANTEIAADVIINFHHRHYPFRFRNSWFEKKIPTTNTGKK